MRSFTAVTSASCFTLPVAARAVNARIHDRYVKASALSGSSFRTCVYSSIALPGSEKFNCRALDNKPDELCSIPPDALCPGRRCPDCRATPTPAPAPTARTTATTTIRRSQLRATIGDSTTTPSSSRVITAVRAM